MSGLISGETSNNLDSFIHEIQRINGIYFLGVVRGGEQKVSVRILSKPTDSLIPTDVNLSLSRNDYEFVRIEDYNARADPRLQEIDRKGNYLRHVRAYDPDRLVDVLED